VEGRTLPVRNPRALRPWQHVLEPLSGYLSLAARMSCSDDPTWCDGWNFGPLPGDQTTVGDLVDLFVAAWGQGNWQDASCPAQLHEAGVLQLSIEKALQKLQWRPRWRLDEAVRRTADWYRTFYCGGVSMRDACLADIAAYDALERVPAGRPSR
jgi:CDP-glucose 4,6-dehydratase